jgi:hypothetical protein
VGGLPTLSSSSSHKPPFETTREKETTCEAPKRVTGIARLDDDVVNKRRDQGCFISPSATHLSVNVLPSAGQALISVALASETKPLSGYVQSARPSSSLASHLKVSQYAFEAYQEVSPQNLD